MRFWKKLKIEYCPLPDVRILFDECLPRKLRREFVGHDVKTVPEMGWAAYTNGRLLGLAEKSFDVFLTVDRNLSFQQVLARFDIAARSNRLKNLLPCIPKVLAALPQARKGQAQVISA